MTTTGSANARGFTTRCRAAKRPLPGALPVGHAARAPVRVPTPGLPELRCRHAHRRLITDAAPVRRILNHIGEPAVAPPISPARGPPAWDDPPIEAVSDWDALAQPQPEYVFDQQVQW